MRRGKECDGTYVPNSSISALVPPHGEEEARIWLDCVVVGPREPEKQASFQNLGLQRSSFR